MTDYMVRQPVQHRYAQSHIGNLGRPFRERQVGGHHLRRPLGASGDPMEQQFRGVVRLIVLPSSLATIRSWRSRRFRTRLSSVCFCASFGSVTISAAVVMRTRLR